MVRITITLDDLEKVGLQLLAEKEFRDPRSQAAFIIHKELEKQGFIDVSPELAPHGTAETVECKNDSS